ncbi:hypothetical protein [Evtepia sp.]|uniref:hypothetical protein n=1 Tax=Evtepia sp. TaxID=2773933 RepID=UPI00399AB341
MVFGAWALDYKLRIDDPVGAVAVHCLNGIWGTVAVGLFATTAALGTIHMWAVLRRRCQLPGPADAGHALRHPVDSGHHYHHLPGHQENSGTPRKPGGGDHRTGRHRARPALCLCRLCTNDQPDLSAGGERLPRARRFEGPYG